MGRGHSEQFPSQQPRTLIVVCCHVFTFYIRHFQKIYFEVNETGAVQNIEASQHRHQCLSVPVAQWKARRTSNPKAAGSIPARDATLFCIHRRTLHFCQRPIL